MTFKVDDTISFFLFVYLLYIFPSFIVKKERLTCVPFTFC